VTDSASSPSPTGRSAVRVTLAGVLIATAIGVLVVFWTWALFFASKEAVNRIEDRAWAERAEEICALANLEREALADFRRIDPDDPDLLRERSVLIDRSTDIIEQMIDDVVAVPPIGDKGAAIVPDWESDYRVLIANRRDFATSVAAGSYEPFRERQVSGIPISERLRVFANDNEMGSCAPPRDL